MVSENITSVIEHKKQVASFMSIVATALFQRASVHDNSKFSPEEFEAFEEATPLLKTLTYGSEEYKQALAMIKPALEHHYKVNNHHPEYYENGVNDMSLIDLIEMVCDWIAATMRVKNGNIYTSLPINQERFGIDDQLAGIIKNTVDEIKNGGTRPAKGNIDYPDVLF